MPKFCRRHFDEKLTENLLKVENFGPEQPHLSVVDVFAGLLHASVCFLCVPSVFLMKNE